MPEKESEKAYALLLKTLEDSGRVAIATVTMHQREYTVFIRPRESWTDLAHDVFCERDPESGGLRRD